MRMHTTLGVILAGTLAVTGAGVAAGQQLDSASPPPPTPVASDAPVAPPAGPGNLGAAHQTSNSALRAHLEPAGRGYLQGSDWRSARSFAIPGTQLRGWTFEQLSRRCLALPDPRAEGYGVTCKTPEEITAGEASVIFAPPAKSGAPNIVGILVSGDDRASIDAPSGTVARFERIGDSYVGIVPTGSHLVTPTGKKLAIKPSTEEFVPSAPPSGR